MTDTVEQKQSWGELLHVRSQKARDALPGQIRETILIKCAEVAETGKMEHEFTLKELDIKTTDKAEQGHLLDRVCELLKADDLVARKVNTGGWAAEWVGIYVAWANVKVTPKTDTPALKHEIEI